tara:strand:- start:494 stop:925 length:432 start_codon:yes stop_codon:yes gene_type:complete
MLKDITKLLAEIYEKIGKFLSPLFLVDMALKTSLLFYTSFQLSRVVDWMFPPKDDNKDEAMVWLEVLVQASVCCIVVFLFRTILSFLGNKFDFLNDEMSNLSTKGSALIAGMAFMAMQKNLTDKITLLKSKNKAVIRTDEDSS